MKLVFSAILTLIFVACDSNSVDSSVVSRGAVMSDEARQTEQKLDKKSYAEISDIFLDTSNLDFSRDVLIVFGKNNCPYCDLLKKDIKDSATLKTLIANNFNPYYINTSYSKVHNIRVGAESAQIKTLDFAEIFSVQNTPTIVVFGENFRIKAMLPGYVPDIEGFVEGALRGDLSGDYTRIEARLREILGEMS